MTDLPTAWRAAIRFCPYCSAAGCERCRETGDLIRAMLEQAYELGREDAVHQIRELFKVTVLAGRHASGNAPPPDLKQKLGLW